MKCKIARIAVLKSVQFTVSGLKYIDLRHEAIKILGTYFPCNKTIREESNFLKVFPLCKLSYNSGDFEVLLLKEE